MAEYFKGTLLASPIVRGSSGDTYGTHHSTLGVGGYMEVKTNAERDVIPIGTTLNYDGISSGQRRLGMLVKVLSTNKLYELRIPYNDWLLLSDEQKLITLGNNGSNWAELSLGNNTGGENISKTFRKTNHEFLIGDPIEWDLISQSFNKALAVSANTETIGIVSSIIDDDNFTVVFSGFLRVPNTITVNGGIIQENTLYYISPNDRGILTDAEPVIEGQVSKPILVTLDNNNDGFMDAIVLQYRGGIVTPQSGTAPTGSTTTSISSENVTKRYVTTTPHEFTVKTVVAIQNGIFVKAIANGTMNNEIIGVVSKVVNNVTFDVTFSGFIPNITGLLNNTTYYLSPTISGGLTATKPSIVGEIIKPVLITKDNGDAIVLSYKPEIISSNEEGVAAIGDAEDNNYSDGYFTDFNATMRAGIPVDRFNQLFKSILPQPAPNLTSVNSVSSFVSGKLSFGSSRNDIGYSNVDGSAGNSIIDVNGLYTISGTRLGVTQGDVNGNLNSGVNGDVSGIPYLDYAIGNANSGSISLKLNGSVVNIVDLTSTTNAINNSSNNTTISLSELKSVKLENGNDVINNYYRTGTFNVDTLAMTNGFNYIQVTYSSTTINTVTNYLEWVYDPESTSIDINTISLTNVNLSGSRIISGVKYYTGGYVDINYNVNNAYKNIYYDGNAILYPTKVNLDNPASTLISGTTIVSGNSLVLPNLRTDVNDPQNGSISVVSTLPISPSTGTLLGSVGDIGKVETNIRVLHPISSKSDTSNSTSKTGFLINNITPVNNLETEDFSGETYRLEARDYKTLSYVDINGTSYAWNSLESLVGINIQHNTGLLIFNKELIYPNSNYLTTTYGITTGNFASVTYSPASNVNYSAASGIRNFYRKFKSNNSITQSTLSFQITHSGILSNFLTDDGSGGTPVSNNLKFEFLIVRPTGNIGWANPFSTDGLTQSGIANTSASHTSGITTVTCTLGSNRVAIDDIIIIRIFASNTWINKISNIRITNI